MVTQEVLDHVLLRLQVIMRNLEFLDIKRTQCVRYDLYELAGHLGFSPSDVNKEVRKNVSSTHM
jgi:hypothetical protein